jgi:hypothetical protein
MAVGKFFEGIQGSLDITVYDPSEIRRELFKLYYEQNEFVLYQPADTFEAMDKILTALHTWLAESSSVQAKPVKAGEDDY